MRRPSHETTIGAVTALAAPILAGTLDGRASMVLDGEKIVIGK